jgi:hypothetical protein
MLGRIKINRLFANQPLLIENIERIVEMRACSFLSLSAAIFIAGLSSANAASVYLAPTTGTIDVNSGPAILQLFMDFSDEPTLGGGIDLEIQGPIELLGFTPSSYFNTLDTAFTGYSTNPVIADGNFALWFGDFDGLSGIHELGTLTFDLLATGDAAIDVNINNWYGPFISADTLEQQTVALNGATLHVAAVPVPAALWFFTSALGVIGGVRLRRGADGNT